MQNLAEIMWAVQRIRAFIIISVRDLKLIFHRGQDEDLQSNPRAELWRYLNLRGNGFYIVFPAQGIMS